VRPLRLSLSLLFALAIAACGGGGSDSDGAGAAAATISGTVVKGPVAGATVQLHAVAVDGTRTLLEQTQSAGDGRYAFAVAPVAGAVLLVTASGGRYVDEPSGTSVPLALPLRAAVVWAGTAQRVSPTPFSEAAVRALEQAAAPDWSVPAVRAANTVVAGLASSRRANEAKAPA